MAVTFKSVAENDTSAEWHSGSVRHNGRRLEVVLVGSISRLRDLVGKTACAEFELNEVLEVKVGLERDDSKSGLFPLPDGQIQIDGTVHQIIKVEADTEIVDVYIQNGAEFIAFDSEQIQNAKPQVGTRIQIRGEGLKVFPTFT